MCCWYMVWKLRSDVDNQLKMEIKTVQTAAKFKLVSEKEKFKIDNYEHELKNLLFNKRRCEWEILQKKELAQLKRFESSFKSKITKYQKIERETIRTLRIISSRKSSYKKLILKTGRILKHHHFN